MAPGKNVRIANSNYDDNYDNYNTKNHKNRQNKKMQHDENNNDFKEIDRLTPDDDERCDGNIDMMTISDDLHQQCGSEPLPDMYQCYKFGDCIPRSGKVFSYTFWRTKANADVFWSIQGNNEMEGAVGGVWIATQYFGNPSTASKFRQEITFTHPTEHNIQMTYASPLTEGENCVFVSKAIVHHFRKEDNSIDFDFRIVRAKKNHRNRKKAN